MKDRLTPIAELGAFALSVVVLLVPSLQAVAGAGLGPAWTVLDIAAYAVLHVGILTARRLPVSTYVGACVAMLVLALSPALPITGGDVPAILFPSALIFFYALMALAAQRELRISLIGLIVAALGSAVVVARLMRSSGWSSQLGEGTTATWLLGGVALAGALAAWALGRLRRSRRIHLAGIEQRARLDERSRIAAEIHDVVSHSLAVMVAQAEGGRMIASDAETKQVLSTVAETGREALRDMRAMLGVLREDTGPAEPQPTVQEIAALAERAGASYECSGQPRPVDAATGLAAYRIVQESLTNALKHGNGAATVQAAWTDRLELSITSPARSRRPASGGSGIVGMRERAESVGGRLTAQLQDGVWRVHAVLPLEVT